MNALYAGWIRTVPVGDWRRVCEEETHDECWRVLDLILPSEKDVTERVVLPAEDGHPSRGKKRK